MWHTPGGGRASTGPHRPPHSRHRTASSPSNTCCSCAYTGLYQGNGRSCAGWGGRDWGGRLLAATWCGGRRRSGSLPTHHSHILQHPMPLTPRYPSAKGSVGSHAPHYLPRRVCAWHSACPPSARCRGKRGQGWLGECTCESALKSHQGSGHDLLLPKSRLTAGGRALGVGGCCGGCISLGFGAAPPAPPSASCGHAGLQGRVCSHKTTRCAVTVPRMHSYAASAHQAWHGCLSQGFADRGGAGSGRSRRCMWKAGVVG